MDHRIHDAIQDLRRQGYVIVEGVLRPDTLADLRGVLASHLTGRRFGRNSFEGFWTERIYTLVARGSVFEYLAEHPLVLTICDSLLLQNYLLSASQAICIHPAEAAQPFHTDDAFYPIARPRNAFSVAAIWAIDDFTEENGATDIIPHSHEWADDWLVEKTYGLTGAERSELQRTARPVTMSAGSVLVPLGTLVHRGGANRSDRPRLAITNQYCEPWARPQENYCLAIDRAQVAAMSERLQNLLGYSIHPPFLGHVSGLHPKRWLEPPATRRQTNEV